ncbi:hypothetical protein AVEN_54736-1 [Araneus ventricosus]|uniref:Uncharacterized protein n=1 Tax=Araneus ventricosus TaxID=182803 RepID=A0A4Y2FBL0_ARAVE|nr:hypothetical protein AVEN_54736-1 [Araneus ventricosus]
MQSYLKRLDSIDWEKEIACCRIQDDELGTEPAVRNSHRQAMIATKPVHTLPSQKGLLESTGWTSTCCFNKTC